MIKYHKEHTWVLVDGDTALIGITDYAQDQLGEIVYVDLPEEEAELVIDEEFGQIESTKTTSEMIAPLSGEVIESNMALESRPELINESSEAEGWITKIIPDDLSEMDRLMDKEEYLNSLEEIGFES